MRGEEGEDRLSRLTEIVLFFPNHIFFCPPFSPLVTLCGLRSIFMIQRKVYTKEELKNGIVTELEIDFELLVDELSNWITHYVINHHLKFCDEKDLINV